MSYFEHKLYLKKKVILLFVIHVLVLLSYAAEILLSRLTVVCLDSR